jgi:hypothetical protein
MKKFTILLAMTIGVSAWSQCHKSEIPSSVTATFSGGFAKTMCGELSFRLRTFYAGAGVGVMVDNEIRNEGGIIYTRNDHAYFVNLGFQKDNIHYGVRIGNQTIVHVTGTVGGVRQELPNENKLLVGALIGYSVTPRIRFNLGYDTFNKVNLGAAFGL